MSTEIRMPRLSDNMETGRIIRWYKQEGDTIRQGEPLAEVETDKADVELEADRSGVLIEIRVPEGGSAAVGEVIAVFGAEGEAGKPKASKTPQSEEKPTAKAEKPAERAAAKAPEEKKEPSLTNKEMQKAPEAKPDSGRTTLVTPFEAPRSVLRPLGAGMRVSPLAWRLAEELGVNLSGLKGSGPGGRIVKRDVELAAEKAKTTARQVPEARKEEPPRPPAITGVQPPSRMRHAIAQRMAQSKREIPHFYVTVEIDMTDAMRMRRDLKELGKISNLTVTHLVIRALTLALLEHPRVNASWTESGVEFHDAVHMGIAVAVEDGLIVPVLRNCEKLSLRQIADGASGLIEKARSGKFGSADLSGGTFSLSNLGMLDIEEFSAIINPPQAALLATGAVKERPVVRNGQLAVAKTMRATLSCDHRVLNGIEAGQFLEELKQLLEHPALLLVD